MPVLNTLSIEQRLVLIPNNNTPYDIGDRYKIFLKNFGNFKRFSPNSPPPPTASLPTPTTLPSSY